MALHAVDGGVHLLKIADAGADAQGVAPAVFDFQIGQIQLRLTSGQQAYAGPGQRETKSDAFADPAARTRNQNAFIFDCSQP
jgi:hypothetical protein